MSPATPVPSLRNAVGCSCRGRRLFSPCLARTGRWSDVALKLFHRMGELGVPLTHDEVGEMTTGSWGMIESFRTEGKHDVCGRSTSWLTGRCAPCTRRARRGDGSSAWNPHLAGLFRSYRFARFRLHKTASKPLAKPSRRKSRSFHPCAPSSRLRGRDRLPGRDRGRSSP